MGCHKVLSRSAIHGRLTPTRSWNQIGPRICFFTCGITAKETPVKSKRSCLTKWASVGWIPITWMLKPSTNTPCFTVNLSSPSCDKRRLWRNMDSKRVECLLVQTCCCKCRPQPTFTIRTSIHTWEAHHLEIIPPLTIRELALDLTGHYNVKVCTCAIHSGLRAILCNHCWQIYMALSPCATISPGVVAKSLS